MSIITERVTPPIPTSDYDWDARFSFFDGDDDLCGVGPTEFAAVYDLIVGATEFDDDGSCMEEIITLAMTGWVARQ